MNKVVGFVLLAVLATTGFALNIPGIPTDFTQDDDVLAALSADIAERYAVEYKQYLKTGKISPTLRHISEQMSKAHSKKDIFTQDITELAVVDQFVACTSCQAVLKVVADTFVGEQGELNGPQREGFCRKAMLGVCDFFSLQTPEVCNGLFDLNYPIMEYILENTVAEVRSLCGILPIKFCKTKQAEFEFTLNLDKGKPLLTAPKANKPQKTDKDLSVLHLTDIHFDPDYKPGSLAECPEPMCCNRMPAGNVPAYQLAGYWSDYRDCDSPKHLIENTFTQIRGLFDKIDMIYHTGDVVAHNVWSTTKEGNIESLTEADKLLSEKFPGVPVYSILGNHEPHPANVFGDNDLPENLNINWLYEHVWSLWSKWLPADQRTNVLKGGYYTATPKAGLRVIGLNNMDCYMYNWWVYLDGSLVIPQLQWLHDTLLAAEKAGEYVHILAHIPSADSGCWTVWAREYNRIIERFSSTISGIFNGHTHKDELNVHYSQNGHAMMVSWNGGSLTTYSNKNPNFKFYEVEPNTFQVVDQQTFITNLTEANLQGSEVQPVWMLEYSFSERFTDDLSPAGLDKLLVKMAEQPELLREFWRYKMTSADPRLAKGCDNKCLLKTICRLSKSVYNNNTRCRELQAILEKTLGIESTTTSPRPTTTTQKPDGETTTKKPGGEDDGAASITASITTILGLAFLLRYIL